MTLLNSYHMIFSILYIMVMVNNFPQVNADFKSTGDLMKLKSYTFTKDTTFEIKYLNITEGLAQPIRFLLNLMGRSFKDVRINPETWTSVKKEMPFGHVPVLIIDEVIRLTQSTAICRFLATFVRDKLSMHKVSDWEAYLIDSNVDNIMDLQRELKKYRSEIIANNSNVMRIEEIKFKLNNITLPKFLNRFETIVKYNEQHFVRKTLTWADIFFAALAKSIGTIIGNMNYLDNYPNLKKLTEEVLHIEAIETWLKNPQIITI